METAPQIQVVAGAFIVNNQRHVLLVKRGQQNRMGPGKWRMPMGLVEFCEPADRTAVRKTLEETGVTCEIIGKLFEREIIRPEISRHWIMFAFLARFISGEAVNKEPEKHDDVRWFPLDAVPPDLLATTRLALDFHEEQQTRS